MGIFVVFEGGEASGKTTQCEALRRRACSAGLAVTSVREPGGTSAAEGIRQLLKRGDREPLAELFLFSAARASLMASVVRPALERGDTVISDRYIYSTLAYQGYGRGIDLETVRRVNAIATQGLAPELVVLLDLAPECGLQRLPRPEVNEQLGLDLSPERPGAARLRDPWTADRTTREHGAASSTGTRVRDGYLELARSDPEQAGWSSTPPHPPAKLSDLVWEVPRGLEPTSCPQQKGYSIQLSYRGTYPPYCYART